MSETESFKKKLPPETREVFDILWNNLTPSERQSLLSILSSFPSEINLIRRLLRLSATQFKITFGSKNNVAIVGPANVGKSTLYNQLILRKEDSAEVSPLPGTTRHNQTADIGLFTIVDTPGADAVGYTGEKEQEEALSAARQADFLVIMFDAIQGVKKTELDLYWELKALRKPHTIVLNKIDLVRKQTRMVLERVAASLDVPVEEVIPIVAKTGENLDQVIMAIAISEPEIVVALGEALPHFRWQLAWRAIVSAASLSAVIALTPLPIIDFAPLIVTQSVMVLGIARIYNYKISLARARELIVTFGMGFLGRSLFYELSKLGGIPGWLLAAAVASSTTIAMGYAASVWFESGQKLSTKTLRKITSEMTQYLLEILRNLGKRKPTEKDLRQRIAEALEQSPLSRDRTTLDQQARGEGNHQTPTGKAS
ncbi:MAG: GTPase [Anaerolineales bacterium]